MLNKVKRVPRIFGFGKNSVVINKNPGSACVVRFFAEIVAYRVCIAYRFCRLCCRARVVRR
jgi:hypothetical protein